MEQKRVDGAIARVSSRSRRSRLSSTQHFVMKRFWAVGDYAGMYLKSFGIARLHLKHSQREPLLYCLVATPPHAPRP